MEYLYTKEGVRIVQATYAVASNDYAHSSNASRTKFYTKTGWLNKYALQCGFVEEIEFELFGMCLLLYRINGEYVVRLDSTIGDCKTMTRLANTSIMKTRANFQSIKQGIMLGQIVNGKFTSSL